MKKSGIKMLFFLHLMLMLFSLSSLCSKMASRQEFMSFRFILYYGAMIAVLGVYAICWQQIIKRLPLTTAFANKAVTVVWGIIWGAVFFREKITPGKIAGACLIIAGVVMYVRADESLYNREADPSAQDGSLPEKERE